MSDIEQLNKNIDGLEKLLKRNEFTHALDALQLQTTLEYLKQLRESMIEEEKCRQRELDDDPNWRAANPEKYGIKRD